MLQGQVLRWEEKEKSVSEGQKQEIKASGFKTRFLFSDSALVEASYVNNLGYSSTFFCFVFYLLIVVIPIKL